MVTVVDFEPKHAAAFKALNEAWITQYFSLEESDRKMLDAPQSYILDRGGAILMAEIDTKAVGTVALIPAENQRFELAKMAVDPAYQGQSIGYLLGVRAIEKARSLHAKSIYLETNSRLTPAISLYKKLGFKDMTSRPSAYARCNVQMELPLSGDQ